MPAHIPSFISLVTLIASPSLLRPFAAISLLRCSSRLESLLCYPSLITRCVHAASMGLYSPLINADEEGFEKTQLAWSQKGRHCWQNRIPSAVFNLILVISLSCNFVLFLLMRNSASSGPSSVQQQGTHWGKSCFLLHSGA